MTNHARPPTDRSVHVLGQRQCATWIAAVLLAGLLAAPPVGAQDTRAVSTNDPPDEESTVEVTLTDGSDYAPPNGTPGTDNNPIGRFGIQADSAGATLDSVLVGVSASLNTQGVLTFELWHSLDDAFDVQKDSLLSEQEWSLTNPAGPFTDLGLPIPTTQEFVFVAMDLDYNAQGHVVAALSDSMLTISGGTLTNAPSEFPLSLSDDGLWLPVELTSFTATATKGGAVLTWQTASETRNAGFRIQRRADDADSWETVGFVESKTESGTSSRPIRYRFTDTSIPYPTDTFSYRLEQVDTDGSVSYSDTRTVALSPPDELTLHAPSPNPAWDQVTLRYALPSATNVSIQVFDVKGRRVATLQHGTENPGRKEVQFETSHLSSGIYFIRLQARGEATTQRLTVVK